MTTYVSDSRCGLYKHVCIVWKLRQWQNAILRVFSSAAIMNDEIACLEPMCARRSYGLVTVRCQSWWRTTTI